LRSWFPSILPELIPSDLPENLCAGKLKVFQFQICFPRSLNAISSRQFPLVKSFF
jgi:hypothetical protein